jgi:hypothetical protein
MVSAQWMAQNGAGTTDSRFFGGGLGGSSWTAIRAAASGLDGFRCRDQQVFFESLHFVDRNKSGTSGG